MSFDNLLKVQDFQLEYNQVASGTFSSGYFYINESDLTEGVYIATYGNCSGILVITNSMLSASGSSPIRITMPVIYNSSGSAVSGTLHIKKVSVSGVTKFKFTLATDQGTNVQNGFSMYLFKTNLL